MEGAYRLREAVEKGANDCSANNDSSKQHAIHAHVDSGLVYFTIEALQHDIPRAINDTSSVDYCSLLDLRWKSGNTFALCTAKFHPEILLQCL
jgi:hypothetical protein